MKCGSQLHPHDRECNTKRGSQPHLVSQDRPPKQACKAGDAHASEHIPWLRDWEGRHACIQQSQI